MQCFTDISVFLHAIINYPTIVIIIHYLVTRSDRRKKKVYLIELLIVLGRKKRKDLCNRILIQILRECMTHVHVATVTILTSLNICICKRRSPD